MMPKEVNKKTVDLNEVKEKEKLFKGMGCCLKEMLWIFATEMGKWGCPICPYLSPTL